MKLLNVLIKILTSKPDCYLVHLKKELILEKLENYDEAIECCNSVIASRPAIIELI